MKHRAPMALTAGLCAWLLRCGAGAAAERWTVLTDCRLIPNPSNDGDSFHVRSGRRHYIFRLYFVDAPETEDSIPERVQEQAGYFGVSRRSALELGGKARDLAVGLLRDGFTVYTRRQDAQGRSDRKRYFAIVKIGEQYLSDALVSNGLARVYGEGTDLPDGTKEERCWGRLRVLENGAKRRGAGGWAGSRLERGAAR